MIIVKWIVNKETYFVGFDTLNFDFVFDFRIDKEAYFVGFVSFDFKR